MSEPSLDRLRRLVNGLEAEGLAWGATAAHDDAALIEEVRSADAPREERIEALRVYVERYRNDLTASPLLLELIAGDDVVLACEAMMRALPFDGRMRQKTVALLEDSRDELACAAAEALGRRKDRAILPRMLAWAGCESRARRRAGLRAMCWIVSPAERLMFVAHVWDTSEVWADEDSRMELAGWLVDGGDARCAEFIAAVADGGGRNAQKAAEHRERLRRASDLDISGKL